MKTKKFSKKLTLSRTTIADLKSNEMKDVQGGIDKPPVSIIVICMSSPDKQC